MGGDIGAAQGYWIAYWKIPSFIVTLAGMLVFRGLSLWLLEGQSVGPFPKEFQIIANGFVPDIFPAGIGAALAGLFDVAQVNVLALGFGIVARPRSSGSACASAPATSSYGIEDEPRSFFIARNRSSPPRSSSSPTSCRPSAVCPTCC
jgi:putative multiple sugar transport system permease protein